MYDEFVECPVCGDGSLTPEQRDDVKDAQKCGEERCPICGEALEP